MTDELIERLRLAAMASYRSSRVSEVTCLISLERKAQGRWEDTSCANLHEGHRCHCTVPTHTDVHQCPCGERWTRGSRVPGRIASAMGEGIHRPSSASDACLHNWIFDGRWHTCGLGQGHITVTHHCPCGERVE